MYLLSKKDATLKTTLNIGLFIVPLRLNDVIRVDVRYQVNLDAETITRLSAVQQIKTKAKNKINKI